MQPKQKTWPHGTRVGLHIGAEAHTRHASTLLSAAASSELAPLYGNEDQTKLPRGAEETPLEKSQKCPLCPALEHRLQGRSTWYPTSASHEVQWSLHAAQAQVGIGSSPPSRTPGDGMSVE
jgi:hypothetical protein